MNQSSLADVDWSKIPAPTDDGGAAHLTGMTIPPVTLLPSAWGSVPLKLPPPSTTFLFAASVRRA